MKYVILRPVEPPKICFLWEALYWRAFGSYPTGYWDDKGRDLREHAVESGFFEPSIPDYDEDHSYLSEEQTSMAGLPPDPSLQMLLSEESYWKVPHYDEMIERFENGRNNLPEELAKLRAEREHAIAFWIESDDWNRLHDAYIDEFQAELLLSLKRGEITATGRKLPRADRDRTERLFERLGCYTEDIPPEKVPKDLWVSNYVNWRECSISSPDTSFVWIAVEVDDLINLFPPTKLIAHKKLVPVGDCFAMAENAIAAKSMLTTKARGRPALPWEDFYIEVARLYRDRQMPAKKEAAIQHFQTWFEKSLGLKASRSAIGQKLKPFFDRLSET